MILRVALYKGRDCPDPLSTLTPDICFETDISPELIENAADPQAVFLDTATLMAHRTYLALDGKETSGERNAD